MPVVRYHGPIDEVDVVGVGVVKRGDEVDVTDVQAAALLDQPDNFAAVVKSPAKKKDD